MIISDLNYVESVSTEEIQGGDTAKYGSLIAKNVRLDILQSAGSSSVAFGGLNGVAAVDSYVGSVTANTNATSSATNNLNLNFSA
jgi:hypothetical protein